MRPGPHGTANAPAPARHDAFAVTAPGLAPLCADELRALGIAVREVEEAGVAFDATDRDLMRANLWLRTASRVLVRLDEFRALSFAELEHKGARVPWERVVAPGRSVRLRVTCRKSRLYHSDAVAERVARAVTGRVKGARAVVATRGDEEEGHDAPEVAAGAPDRATPDAQLLVVRFLHDRCTISADASGELLHRRGWRQAVGRAPLRETLAAAMLLAAGYDGSGPLCDPLCGSGTIAIEAALLARRMAPGRHRRFAFERWPGHDAAAWRALLAEADAGVVALAHPILATDRDAGAVAATLANAERAGVADTITVERRALSDVALDDAVRGWVVTNPPYGKRVGETDALRDLWARLGQWMAQVAPGWRAALLGPDARLESQLARELGASLVPALRTSNGGLPVRVLVGAVPEDTIPEGTVPADA